MGREKKRTTVWIVSWNGGRAGYSIKPPGPALRHETLSDLKEVPGKPGKFTCTKKVPTRTLPGGPRGHITSAPPTEPIVATIEMAPDDARMPVNVIDSQGYIKATLILP